MSRCAGNRVIEARRAAGQRPFAPITKIVLSDGTRLGNVGRLGPDRAIGRFGGNDQHGCVLRVEQVGDRIFIQEIVDRACDTRDLGAEQGREELRQDRAEKGDSAAVLVRSRAT